MSRQDGVTWAFLLTCEMQQSTIEASSHIPHFFCSAIKLTSMLSAPWVLMLLNIYTRCAMYRLMYLASTD